MYDFVSISLVRTTYLSRTYNINWQQYASVFQKLPDLACHHFLLSNKIDIHCEILFLFFLNFW